MDNSQQNTARTGQLPFGILERIYRFHHKAPIPLAQCIVQKIPFDHQLFPPVPEQRAAGSGSCTALSPLQAVFSPYVFLQIRQKFQISPLYTHPHKKSIIKSTGRDAELHPIY